MLNQTQRREVFARRRQDFLKKMRGGLAVLKTYSQKYRNIHHEYPFRPSSCFYYLTGCAEPEAIALFAPEQPDEKFVLFLRPPDKTAEIWGGKRPTAAQAKRRYGADAVYTLDQFEKILMERFSPTGRFFHEVGIDTKFDSRILEITAEHRALGRRGKPAPTDLIDPQSIIQWQRSRKSPEEIAWMEEAARITAAGHIAAMEQVRPGMYEYEVEALMGYEFRRRGASGFAYLPIVGSGNNATCLHHTENQGRLKGGDLVLMDCGAEYEYYACDVTRTIPISGTFSTEQRAVYDVVLSCQKKLINMIKPGVRHEAVQRKAIELLTRGLVKLGILKGEVKRLIRDRKFFPFYMHGFGHWIGLDTHDACPYRTPTGEHVTFQPGMVLTVEPGLYIAKDNKKAAAKWRGIGVRIEDNILVTRSGNRNLTVAIPKEADEIEAQMAGG